MFSSAIDVFGEAELLELVTVDGDEDTLVARVSVDQPGRLPTDVITTGARATAMRTLLAERSLEEPSRMALALLDRRISAGDSELREVSLLLQYYETILSCLPPLAHNSTLPLRPSDELYAFFDQLIDLLRQQGQQIAEMNSILAELI
jgi:hypothetical protein